jgi:hypothetical protein
MVDDLSSYKRRVKYVSFTLLHKIKQFGDKKNILKNIHHLTTCNPRVTILPSTKKLKKYVPTGKLLRG